MLNDFSNLQSYFYILMRPAMLSVMHRFPCPRDAEKMRNVSYVVVTTDIKDKDGGYQKWESRMHGSPLALEMVEKKVECVGGSGEGGGFKT